MKTFRLFFILSGLLLTTNVFAQLQSPAQIYPGLFEQVQMQQVYTDGKTFVDARPKARPTAIMQAYRIEHIKKGFNIQDFAHKYFDVPAVSSTVYRSNVSAGVRKHIDTLWTVLQHVADTVKGTSLLPLPYNYVVPGGRFREIYYWDSYFTMLGLAESKRYDLIESMVKNFAYLIDRYGHIPNGNRTYYLSRSQPPFFSLMVELLAKYKGKEILVTYRPQLIKEYQYWMHGAVALKPGAAVEHTIRLADGSLLNRYWDSNNTPREESYREDVLAGRQTTQKPPDFYRNIRAAAESGWDFSSRWMADGKTLATIQTTSLAAVDLNSLIYHLETVIARSYTISVNTKMAAFYQRKAALRKVAVLKYCWDKQNGCFKDYQWQRKKLSNQISIAMAYPLFFNLADKEQAEKVAALIQKRFLQQGGVATTAVNTGQQWDAPNGWAPLQYITIKGLQNYGYSLLAKTIAQRWMQLNIASFKQTGKLLEKYDVQNGSAKAGGGEYPLQDGFGWTNGVLLKLMNEFK
ncbi:alpha,alpha-trehalase TreA [Mucilaginibacter sp. CSA2-8R]|uniref:alpha,alpha-trehalase TreA n=1 Tax=Mucilaginibacter sp. CSA2-8R TaxID=3141542 RepID=UPI00315D0084